VKDFDDLTSNYVFVHATLPVLKGTIRTLTILTIRNGTIRTCAFHCIM